MTGTGGDGRRRGEGRPRGDGGEGMFSPDLTVVKGKRRIGKVVGRPRQAQGIDVSRTTNGNVAPSFLTSLSSAVTNSHPSRSARATYRQSYIPCRWRDESTYARGRRGSDG